ncbi:uncharacterized protein A1O5_00175 [Cladophialophora psammophila CBS 110553]|uniref:Cytochrome P450 oxidoreductase n=1 Tax=Cladophialophora psammophila CBS 110553 TaxID=1182543 RepID=W9X5Z8_9EURO|nr:uncharacterized protein A1O5_00175 [Cladophialophora psammophila CBS 110553]EXJ75668.1 hypothetical protein A1O5_00175 [Cladophialophora psammophila CBS 110553]
MLEIGLEHPRLAALVALITGYILYSTFFDPLRNIPGPFLARRLPGWLAYQAFTCNTETAILEVHAKYGDVVRVGPNTVLAGSAEAVPKVLGYGEHYLDKGSDYNALVFHTPSIFSEVDKSIHSRKRRIAAHAYSMQSLMRMEDLVLENVAIFLHQMDQFARSGETMDAAEWFKFYAFDVIGDLAFGKSFGLLKRGVTGEFVTHISSGVEYTFVLFLLPSLLRPLSRFLVKWLPIPLFRELNHGFAYVKKETAQLVQERWEKRDDASPQRGDILGALIEATNPVTKERLGFGDLATNASTNIVAGSDTITISLTGILYRLLRNPDKAAKLVAEVRRPSLGDSTSFKDVQKLPYLDGCIKEGMRLTTPFAGPLPRISPRKGFEVAKHYIPPGTIVNVMQCQIHMDERIFPEPHTFQPERWFEDSGGRDLDKYFLGFSTGPRSCIGKNIAILEMKLLLYSLFRRYDLSLSPTTSNLRCLRLLVTKPLSPVLVNIRPAAPVE